MTKLSSEVSSLSVCILINEIRRQTMRWLLSIADKTEAWMNESIDLLRHCSSSGIFRSWNSPRKTRQHSSKSFAAVHGNFIYATRRFSMSLHFPFIFIFFVYMFAAEFVTKLAQFSIEAGKWVRHNVTPIYIPDSFTANNNKQKKSV
jgi:hypothetical protein